MPLLQTEFDKCVLCLGRPVGDPEHIVPECLGGRLTAHVLCDKCNHGLGAQLISKVKRAPEFLLAVNSLPQLAELRKSFLDKAEYSGATSDGSTVRASRRREGMRLLPSKGADGSVAIPSEQIPEVIRKILARAGKPVEEIRKLQETAASLGIDDPPILPNQTVLFKRETPPVFLSLSGPSVPDQFYALIALTFMSLNLGPGIYAPDFDPLRRFIRDGVLNAAYEVLRIQGSPQYGPFHDLRVLYRPGDLRVGIRFFLFLGCEVRIPTAIVGADAVLREDLGQGRTLLARSWGSALAGEWYVIT